jgi:GTP-binding protein
MKPVIALVGRPNVGKSTLFNRLTKSRDAIVADFAGLTRDRHYGDGHLGNREFIVIDTGGFEPEKPSGGRRGRRGGLRRRRALRRVGPGP